MALPTRTQVATMDYASAGGPAVFTAGTSAVNMNTMDYPSEGGPFVGQPFQAAPGGTVAAIIIFIGM